jgi:hypothetical protein
MEKSYEAPPNFLEALFGLIALPGGATEDLLSQEDPPYGATIFLCLFLTLFVPIASQLYKYGVTVYDNNAIFSIFFVIFITLLIFLIVEGLFLQILGVDIPLKHLTSMVAYCTVPFMFAIWLIYLFNYLSTGNLSLLKMLMTGFSVESDRFLQVTPLAFFIAQLMVLLVFFYSIRFLGRMHFFTAFAVTLLSLIPFYLSFIIALLLGNSIRPGTFDIFMQIIASPKALTVFS